ncbi:hypothetical protein AAG570_002181 [Ranatra chinensis]|uniref:Isopropylmalate dehydrogenase-like domain-containing protein n=1 Tax=Ranatra chinensis TaxID=642074 RepID=A0ABD0Y6R5_9HEMI
MASKRRNMFYENKKQETTEIGDIDARSRYDPNEKYFASRNWHLRRLLDLYVFVVECKSLPVKASPVKADFDVVVLRQNTEGVFALLDHAPVKSVVENLGVYTRFNCLRIAKYGF